MCMLDSKWGKTLSIKYMIKFIYLVKNSIQSNKIKPCTFSPSHVITFNKLLSLKTSKPYDLEKRVQALE